MEGMNNSGQFEQIEVPFKVEPHHSGLRLDEFMKTRLPSYSRNEIHNIIETRLVQKVRKLKKGTIVRTSDEVVFLYDKKEEAVQDVDIPVLYEDDHLLIVNKPPDMSVHSNNPWGKNDLIQQLRRQRNSRELYLAHRIDRETSGLVLIAKSITIASKLGEAFFGRKVEKEYTALVFGEMADDNGVIDLPICGDEKAVVRVKMTADRDSGAPSITEYRVLKRLNGFTMVSARPKTGRQHQIRVHLSAIGHPLVGDKIYKDEKLFLRFIKDGFTEELKKELLLPRHALHASRLSFKHPVTGIQLNIEAEMPDDLITFIKKVS
ncbi:MAG: RNA pseudouridine synthase family protein [Deltaproteobacteria bacterium]|nr:RNA pseudouridine synthase family protein [Deltaproteobacteria bacterium]